MRILGIDPALANTGLAHIVDGRIDNVLTLKTTGTKTDTVNDRAARLHRIAQYVADHTYIADLVVIEGPAYGRADPSFFDRAGLWWRIVGPLIQPNAQPNVYGRHTTLAVVPPTVLKKFATGKGNADKTAVAAHMARLWPDATAASEHEWDALALATIGAAHLGHVPTRAHHNDVLTRISWPANLTAEEPTCG